MWQLPKWKMKTTRVQLEFVANWSSAKVSWARKYISTNRYKARIPKEKIYILYINTSPHISLLLPAGFRRWNAIFWALGPAVKFHLYLQRQKVSDDWLLSFYFNIVYVVYTFYARCFCLWNLSTRGEKIKGKLLCEHIYIIKLNEATDKFFASAFSQHLERPSPLITIKNLVNKKHDCVAP